MSETSSLPMEYAIVWNGGVTKITKTVTLKNFNLRFIYLFIGITYTICLYLIEYEEHIYTIMWTLKLQNLSFAGFLVTWGDLNDISWNIYLAT